MIARVNRSAAPVVLPAIGGAGEHEGRDGRAWAGWEEAATVARRRRCPCRTTDLAAGKGRPGKGVSDA